MNDEEKLILPNLTKLICDKTEREMVLFTRRTKGSMWLVEQNSIES